MPLTTKVDRLYPSEAYVTVEGRQSKAMADQIATVSKKRLLTRIGQLSPPDPTELERAVKVQMGL